MDVYCNTDNVFSFNLGNAEIYLPLISSGLIDLLPLQNKNGQLMGATVHSEDGYFVVCVSFSISYHSVSPSLPFLGLCSIMGVC